MLTPHRRLQQEELSSTGRAVPGSRAIRFPRGVSSDYLVIATKIADPMPLQRSSVGAQSRAPIYIPQVWPRKAIVIATKITDPMPLQPSPVEAHCRAPIYIPQVWSRKNIGNSCESRNPGISVSGALCSRRDFWIPACAGMTVATQPITATLPDIQELPVGGGARVRDNKSQRPRYIAGAVRVSAKGYSENEYLRLGLFCLAALHGDGDVGH